MKISWTRGKNKEVITRIENITELELRAISDLINLGFDEQVENTHVKGLNGAMSGVVSEVNRYTDSMNHYYKFKHHHD